MSEEPNPKGIWDSRKHEPADGHPLLMAALEIVLANFDECLSRCYAKVHKKEDADHKKIIYENLPGKFSLGFSDIEPKSYAYTYEGGICFNESLVLQSTDYVLSGQTRKKVTKQLQDNPAADINIEIDGTIAAYVAILQQSIEHEIFAHSKHHNDPKFKKKSPKKNQEGGKYVKGEAGYAVQATISRTHTPRLVNAFQQPSVLEVDPDCCRGSDSRRWFLPGNMLLRRGVIYEDNGEYKSKLDRNYPDDLTLDDIKKFMEYPTKKKEGPACDDVKFEPPPDGPRDRGRRKRDREDDDDDNSDEGADSDSRWFRSVQDKVNWSVKDVIARELAREESMRETTFETTKEGYDPSWEWDPDESEEEANSELQKQCKVLVVFCDAQRNAKPCFDECEDIYASIAIKNESATENVYFETTSGKSFGRFGLGLEIDGIASGYTVSDAGCGTRVKVLIQPGKSYKFVRKFTDGGEKSPFCMYQTPPPGTYTTQVSYRGHLYPEKFDFAVGRNSNRSGALEQVPRKCGKGSKVVFYVPG